MSAWGLYKPGQGYWVRVMTAAAIAIITFATAGWAMSQASVLAEKLPVRSWTALLAPAANTAAPTIGERVTLLGAGEGGQPGPIGTARITAYDPGASGAAARLDAFEPATPDARAEFAVGIAPTGPTGFAAPVRNIRGVPIVQSTILQGLTAAAILLGGAALAYYLCGVRRGTAEFLIATDMEMKKVAWTTRRDIFRSTMVVVGASFMLAAVLFGIDLVFQSIFTGIDLLQKQ